MLRFIIADDHPVLREGFKRLLADTGKNAEVMESSDVDGIIQLLKQGDDYDLILMDYDMPGMGAFSGLRKIKRQVPHMPVAIISGFHDHDTIRSALAAGADGFIPKQLAPQVFVNAVQLILSGETYLPSLLLAEPPSMESVDSSLSRHDDAIEKNLGAQDLSEEEALSEPPRLTKRQKETLVLMKEGCSNKEIAKKMGCAEGTVKAHVTAILRAFKVTNRTKAIAAARRWMY
ncbi:MAG: response regulator transcription factor [Magnetococcales bacterium]|nr:response regulator transcription factor [Magnetococcales bacterium]